MSYRRLFLLLIAIAPMPASAGLMWNLKGTLTCDNGDTVTVGPTCFSGRLKSSSIDFYGDEEFPLHYSVSQTGRSIWRETEYPLYIFLGETRIEGSTGWYPADRYYFTFHLLSEPDYLTGFTDLPVTASMRFVGQESVVIGPEMTGTVSFVPAKTSGTVSGVPIAAPTTIHNPEPRSLILAGIAFALLGAFKKRLVAS